ncbi:hypothetical protein C8R43DRAFT_254633 [Mycena crocata]|nr:hypothetical protein C8R43DRAFT_254633 [Mycena crocata]
MTLSQSVCFMIGALSAVHTVAGVPWPSKSSPRHGLGVFNSRQAGGNPVVPPQCASTCDPINTILETNTCPPATCCSDLFQSGYFNCLKCVGLAANATVAEFAQAQTLLDGLTVACSKEGFSLPELTLPGQNSSRTLSTVSSGGRVSTTLSQITISALPSLTSGTPMPILSQKTVTAPTFESTTSTGPAAPTTSTNSNDAAKHVVYMTPVLASIIAGWMTL